MTALFQYFFLQGQGRGLILMVAHDQIRAQQRQTPGDGPADSPGTARHQGGPLPEFIGLEIREERLREPPVQ